MRFKLPVKGVSGLFKVMADQAKISGLPPPVIRTDTYSAAIMKMAIDCETGWRSPSQSDCICLYEGIKIIIYRETSDHSAFRDHFGVLADIWREP